MKQGNNRLYPLQLEELRKRYGDTMALEGLTLAVDSGEIFGLIGPDGGGKTTAMRIACGLLLPDQGKVLVMGYNPHRTPRKAKGHIGYMPQRFSLYPDLTIAENIRFFADLYLVSAEDRRMKEERLMQFSRLGPFRDRRAGRLSGGMKQKLALSCTLIHTPDVLILDEPTTGVDPVSRKEFWSLLRELADQGIALLISTPYMDEALLCDRIVLMHQGKVIGEGSPDKVTDLFPHRLLEVIGDDLVQAKTYLASISDIQVHRFGDCLHIIYDTSEQRRSVERTLADLTVDVHPIAPTMEDTFVALMGSSGGKAVV